MENGRKLGCTGLEWVNLDQNVGAPATNRTFGAAQHGKFGTFDINLQEADVHNLKPVKRRDLDGQLVVEGRMPDE
jgi:hypothetical protein